MSRLPEDLFASSDRSVCACFISKGKFFAAGLCAQTPLPGACKAAGGPWGPGHAYPVPLPAVGPALPRVLSKTPAYGPAGRPAALGSRLGFLPA